MAELAAIRTAIKTAFAGITANIYDYETAKPEHPAIIVGWPETFDPRAMLGGGVDLIIPCRIEVVASRDWQSGDNQLETYLAVAGSQSLIAAIAAAPTLGGTCSSATVIDFNNFGFRTIADATIVMCECRVEVYV